MSKYRDIYCNIKKTMAKNDKQIIQRSKTKNYLIKQQIDEGTKYLNYQSITKQIESQFAESSRIADQCESSQLDFQSFQTCILKKVEQIQEESNRLLYEKETQIYNLKIQLENNQQKLKQAQQMLVLKDKKISRLEYEIQILKNATQYHDYLIKTKQMEQIYKQNQKLKQSLQFLIEQKNQNWKSLNNSNQAQMQNKQTMQKMEQEIENLRQIVEQLESSIKKCSKCYTLTRQKQQLSIAYNYLVKQHLQMAAAQSKKEKQFIKSYSSKIKQNQKILKENLNLKQPQQRRNNTTLKYQGFTDSNTSPCRFFNDYF